MAKVLISEENLRAIGDAIRTKNGQTRTYKPAGEMAAAINQLTIAGNVQDVKTLESVAMYQETTITPDDDYTSMAKVVIAPTVEIESIPNNLNAVAIHLGVVPSDHNYVQDNFFQNLKVFRITVDDKIVFTLDNVPGVIVWGGPLGVENNDNNATAQDIRTGKIAIIDNDGDLSATIGTMPENETVNISVSGTTATTTAVNGYVGNITAAISPSAISALDAKYIPIGTTVLGVDGTLVEYDDYFPIYIDSVEPLDYNIDGYVKHVRVSLSATQIAEITADKIKQGSSIFGVVGTVRPYEEPTGTVEQSVTSNGTYTIDCAGKAQVVINVDVATTGGETDEEEDDDIMTIIPCKVVLDHTQAITSVQFKSDAYSVLATVRDSNKPYAVKVKADIYCDLTIAGMGVVFVENMYMNLSSYNSETYSVDNLNYAVFEGSTAGTTSAYNPMQLTINCDSNAASLLWHHVTNGAMSAESVDATFNLEA